ncbi:MAG: histidine kinase, partial [Bacteroidota bacterium]
AERLGYRAGAAKVNAYFSAACRVQGKLDSALTLNGEALRIYQELGDERGAAVQSSNRGLIQKELGKYEAAIQMHFASLPYFEAQKDHRNLAATYINIANNIALRSDTARVVHYNQLAIRHADSSGNDYIKAMALINLGAHYLSVFSTQAHPEALHEAEISLREAKILSEKLQVPFAKASVYHNLSELHLLQEQHDRALQYAEQALEIYQESDQPPAICDGYIQLAAVSFAAGKTQKAAEAIAEAIAIAEQHTYSERLSDAARRMAAYQKKLGNFQAAYRFLDQHKSLHDSLFSLQQSEIIAETEARYQNEKKARQIEALRNKSKVSDLALSRRNAWLIGGGVSVLAIAGLLFLLFRQRQAQERHRRATLEHRVLRAQMNPHFIFNSLNSIQRLYLEGRTDRAISFTADFSRLLRAILDHSDRPLVTIREEVQTLELYLGIEAARLGGDLEWHLEVEEEVDALNLYLPALILQPYVENAIWHGIVPKDGPGKIQVRIWQSGEDRLLCTVEDDGIGIETRKRQMAETTPTHTSKGMKITLERLGVGGAVEAVERAEGGTCVTIQIPLQYASATEE